MLCASPESKHFLKFINNIFNLEFEEKPNYEKLRFMLVSELLDLGESPSKKYDWNENMFSSSRQHQLRQQNNISQESIEFNEEEMDEGAGINNQNQEYEVESVSDQHMAIQSNLDEKMRHMQGYNFNNNENFKAMKKVIPLLDQAQHVEINSDTIYKDQEQAQALEYNEIMKQESVRVANHENLQDHMRMIVDQCNSRK